MQIALLVATAVAALANWWSRIHPNDRLEAWSKPLTTVLVIGLALVSGAPSEQIAVAVIALTLCLAGDIALMPAIDKFVVGLAAFLLGHLVFIVLFVQYGLESPVLAGVALILAALLVATVGNVIVQGASHADPKLKMPVLAYLVRHLDHGRHRLVDGDRRGSSPAPPCSWCPTPSSAGGSSSPSASGWRWR